MTITENVDDGRGNPFKIGKGLATIVTKMIYPPSMVPREIISNTYDQYIKPQAQGRKHEAFIIISKKKRILCFSDNATGILDIDDFMILGNEFIEGLGKITKDAEGRSYIDPKSKGQYHIAKGGFQGASDAVGDKVIFLSNNGNQSHKLVMRTFGWSAETPEIWDNSEKEPIIPHIGMEIQIIEPKEFLLDIPRMKMKLAEWFGIMLERNEINIQIFDLDTETTHHVYKPHDLKVDDELTEEPELELKSGKQITCRLEKIDKVTDEDNIQIHVRYVGITYIHVKYLVKGWINCDSLSTEMNLSRNGFNQDSDIYNEVIEKLNDYMETRFEKEQQRKVPTDAIKDIIHLANKIQKICNGLFDEPEKLTGVPNTDNPLNKSSDGKDGPKVPKDIEKRKSPKNKSKPRDKKPPTGRTRKPVITKTVLRAGGEARNNPNVKPIIIYDAEQPLISFPQAEILRLNFGRDSSTIFQITKRKVTEKQLRIIMKKKKDILAPLIARAAIEQRTRDYELDRSQASEKFEDVLDAYWSPKIR
jgi:hypothetical protein